eukprot:1160879-Pelagomonas_calceolata.AAC.1
MVGGVIAFLLCMHSKICTGALPPWLHPGPEVPGNSGIEDPACASMPPSQGMGSIDSPTHNQDDCVEVVSMSNNEKDYASQVQLRALRIGPLTSKLARASPRRFTGPA